MKKMMILLLAAMFAGVASANLLTNGDFESGDAGTEAAIPGWTCGPNWYNVTDDTTFTAYTTTLTPHGGSLYSRSGGNVWSPTWLQSIDVEQNTDYTVTFWAAANREDIDTVGLMTGFHNNATGSDNTSWAWTISSAHIAPDAADVGVWQEYTATVNSGSNTRMDVRLVTRHGSDYTGIDDVSVIPEPATLGLFAAFGGGLLLIRRKMAM